MLTSLLYHTSPEKTRHKSEETSVFCRFVIKSEVLPLVGALYEYYKDRFFVSTIDKSYIDVDLKGEDSLSVMKNVLTILDTAKKEDKKS